MKTEEQQLIAEATKALTYAMDLLDMYDVRLVQLGEPRTRPKQ